MNVTGLRGVKSTLITYDLWKGPSHESLVSVDRNMAIRFRPLTSTDRSLHCLGAQD